MILISTTRSRPRRGSRALNLVVAAVLALGVQSAFAASVGELSAGYMLGRLVGAGKGPPLAVPMTAASLGDGNTGTGAIVHFTGASLSGAVLASPVVTGGTFGAPTITSPNVTGGTFGASPAISDPQIAGGLITTATIASPTVTGGTFTSPALLGSATAPTQAPGNNSTLVSTTAFVQAQIAATLATGVTVGGALAVSSDLAVTGNASVTGTTTLTGDMTIAGEIIFGGAANYYLWVTGGGNPVINFAAGKYISYDTASTTISIVNNSHSVSLDQNGNFSAGNNFAVGGNLSVSGAATISGNATVSGNMTVAGCVHYNGGTLGACI